MRRPVLRLLPFCLALACAARAQEVAPPTWDLCPAPDAIPLFRPLPTDPAPAADPATLPTDLSAENLDVSKQEVTVLSGKVELLRGEQWLGTDKLTYFSDSERFSTEGPVQYQDRGLRFIAEKAEGDQKANTVRLDKVQYQFNTQLGNGTADTLTMQGDLGRLDNGTYSTCPPGQRQWEFRAARIDVDQEEGMGTARNATLRLGGVPVMWLPYLRFPTDDRRRTGLLSPTIGHDDRNGFEYEQPIYLNLAPNYDATLKPRWMSERGLMLGGEFRYLTARSRGVLDGTWLPDDDVTGRDRGLVSYQHFTAISPQWFASANLNHVSDDRYFEDFGDSLANATVSLLASDAGIYGRGLGWTASLVAQDWQIANPIVVPGTEPYRRLPTAQAQWNRPFADWLELGIAAEAVRFEHESLDGGSRVDLRPYLRLPFGGAAWFATPELAWRYTAYSLDDALVPAGGSDSPSRSLPIMSLDAGAFFERELNWRGGKFLQTLEPRLYYLNVPYRDQDELPLFDTQPLTFSWPGLFRDNRFGGADRQGDADQVTLALSSRILSANDGREILSAGIGRVHYFDAPRVTVPGAPPLSDDGSAWVAEASLALGERWSLGLAQQWDPDTERTTLSAVRSQWRFGQGGLLNAAYRYRADLLEQTDLSFVLPLNDRWRLMGRWNYSLRDDQTLEALGGFEWRSCCVALRVLGRRYIREFGGDSTTGIYLELELNGVGGLGRNTARLLDDAILDYSRYSR
ncbi:LPS assembly protein LptD [Arenimonas sp. MALMAid1274]|uniref:LPS assembly protein LptD n=1 Tax=Arenimonas sp. MALMAid1274 TaxID=3411630 RepID=UPI003BA14043